MPSRILVVRFGALGDLVLLTVLLRTLRRHFPTATIDVCTKGRYTSLFRNHPAVDGTIAMPPGGTIGDLAGALRDRTYDVKLDAHANLRTRMLRHRVPGPWLTLRKPRLARYLATNSACEIQVPHVTELYASLASSLGAASDDLSPDLYPDASSMAAARAVATGDFVILAPGAQHATKRWPASHWQRLAELLRDGGVTVVGLGLTHEAALLQGTSIINAFGLPLNVGVALCKRARAVIAHDSGLLHVATAVGTPVVAIYGPTTSTLGYAPRGADARFVSSHHACRPCSVYGGRRCPAGHHRCMTSLTPEAVHRAFATLS